MIRAGGTGAAIISTNNDYLYLRTSYGKSRSPDIRLKMNGRKIYEFALSNVPVAMKKSLDDNGYSIAERRR